LVLTLWYSWPWLVGHYRIATSRQVGTRNEEWGQRPSTIEKRGVGEHELLSINESRCAEGDGLLEPPDVPAELGEDVPDPLAVRFDPGPAVGDLDDVEELLADVGGNEDLEWCYAIVEPEKEVEKELTVTRYRQVESELDVMKEREETHCKGVTVFDRPFG